MYPPIFISGPHGGGKTTLTKALLKHNDLFCETDFDIDFTLEFPSIGLLSHFERSLVRLYHRFFLHHYALMQECEQSVLTNRTVYDSEGYIWVYRQLGWISEESFFRLGKILENFKPRPYTIVLNPPVETILARLGGRRSALTRQNRDVLFQSEDSEVFVRSLHDYFATLKHGDRILYLEDNSAADVVRVMDWVRGLNK